MTRRSVRAAGVGGSYLTPLRVGASALPRPIDTYVGGASRPPRTPRRPLTGSLRLLRRLELVVGLADRAEVDFAIHSSLGQRDDVIDRVGRTAADVASPRAPRAPVFSRSGAEVARSQRRLPWKAHKGPSRERPRRSRSLGSVPERASADADGAVGEAGHAGPGRAISAVLKYLAEKRAAADS